MNDPLPAAPENASVERDQRIRRSMAKFRVKMPVMEAFFGASAERRLAKRLRRSVKEQAGTTSDGNG